MLHIYGVNLPNEKKVRSALTNIYGIGLSQATKICNQLGINENIKIINLKDFQIYEISRMIKRDLTVEADLKKKINADIKNLIKTKTYRGMRHKYGLPVHGQRTRSNGKTQKRLSRKYS